MHAVVLLAVLRLTLRLELGPEYDSNANRSEVVAGAENADPPTGSGLLRATAKVGLAWRRGINLLRVQAGLGTKVFFNPDVLDQSVVIVQASADDRVALGRWGEFAIVGDYYDAFQDLAVTRCTNCFRRRDFRTGTSTMRLTLFDGPGTFWFGGGYRGFQYKPDPYFDFNAPMGEAGASVTKRLGHGEDPHDLTLSASYRVERRAYDGIAQGRDNAPECSPSQPLVEGCIVTTNFARSDTFHEAGVELSYVGTLLAALGYTAQLNLSNSFGQSLLRHLITLRLSYRLPWQLYASAKLQLMVSKYLDPVLLNQKVSSQTFVTIEDENRNAVILDLERAVPKLGLAVNARYSFFTNELGSPPTSFRRHVGYVGLTYHFSTR